MTTDERPSGRWGLCANCGHKKHDKRAVLARYAGRQMGAKCMAICKETRLECDCCDYISVKSALRRARMKAKREEKLHDPSIP